MTNVIAELSRWARDLAYWEQAALDKVVAGVQLTDTDYDELHQYLLEDADLAESRGPRPCLPFPGSADVDSQPTLPVRLIEISNLQNVNALVPKQTLTFGPALTAIFGGNGSGKSGYARVLGCAGFTRGDREVLPDVTCPSDDTAILSAEIEINDGAANRVIQYQVGRQCEDLASFYVFDSTSVRVHLTGSNSFSFSPAGLAYLKQLADVTDEVRRRLRVKIEECNQPHGFDALFQGDSVVTQLIAGLGPDTDLNRLRQIANLAPSEHRQIKELDLEIARLKIQDVSRQVTDLRQRIHDLESLASQLRRVQQGYSDATVRSIQDAQKTYLDRQSAAQRVSEGQFKSEALTQTGSDNWYRFIEAARTLADAEGTAEEPYPQPDSHCLLCQQPLSAEARDLLLRLWEFLGGEAQTRLDEALEALGQERNAMWSVSLDLFDDQSVSYRYLHEHAPSLLEKVKAFVAACRRRRESIRGAIDGGTAAMELPALPENGIADIEKEIASLKTQCTDMEKQVPAEEIGKLEERLLELQHRVVLSQNLPEIEGYVEKRIWAQRAKGAGGSTRRITTKHNQLFNQLVTDRYIELFEQTLRDLGRPLEVEVATSGRKGDVYKQIVVRADSSVSAGDAPPDKVLSEGEKRAVALADFLTEVALDTTSSGIILDDPVTSLDLEWRELIASILAEEVKRRQVIVFTHDLPFLYYVKKYCQQQGVDLATHWIKRGEHDDKPGYVFLNNSPALERDYRNAKRAREIYARAKDAPAAEQEILLRDGFGALRTSYEAFIIFELLNEVVMRFDERISFGRLRGIVWDRDIADQVIDKCEYLSRCIEGHLHSDAFTAQKPSPGMLMNEIEAFDALRKNLKELKRKQ